MKNNIALWKLYTDNKGCNILQCSSCGYKLKVNGFGEHYVNVFKFCPICGRKIVGKDIKLHNCLYCQRAEWGPDGCYCPIHGVRFDTHKYCANFKFEE